MKKKTKILTGMVHPVILTEHSIMLQILLCISIINLQQFASN